AVGPEPVMTLQLVWSEAEYRAEDTNDTALRFTDVLFGFALKEIVTRLIEWEQLTTATKLHLVLAALTILGSYVGFRNSQKRGRFKLRFLNLATLRFGLDQVMVFFYFWLAIYVAVDKTDGNGHLILPSGTALLRFDARVLAVIFGLYLVW